MENLNLYKFSSCNGFIIDKETLEIKPSNENCYAPLRIASVDYILKNKNFNNEKLIVYFRKNKDYDLEDCLSNKKIDNKKEILNFFKTDIEKYYQNTYLTCILKDFYNFRNDEKFLYGKWIIENINDGNVILELYTIDSEEKIQKKIFEKKVNKKIKNTIKKIDAEVKEGYYRVPDYIFETSIFTQNRIIHKKKQFLSEDEKKLLSILKNLFEKELENILE